MEYFIPACSGKRIEVLSGQKISIVDVEGGQVVDFFAEVTDMLENHPEVTTIHLHLDNDTAGRAAACNIEDQLKNRYNVRLEFPPRGKDFNDYLMHMRKQKYS